MYHSVLLKSRRGDSYGNIVVSLKTLLEKNHWDTEP